MKLVIMLLQPRSQAAQQSVLNHRNIDTLHCVKLRQDQSSDFLSAIVRIGRDSSDLYRATYNLNLQVVLESSSSTTI